jgi:hypothetical protein
MANNKFSCRVRRAALVFALAASFSSASMASDSPEANKGTKIASMPAAVPLLKGQVTYCVPSGTPIKLKLATVPTYGLSLMSRDLDGKLLPARVNQEITARLTEDIYVDDNKVIPEGTVFHGYVKHIVAPKRVGRPGSLVLAFDYFKRPDGRKFKFSAEANNARKSTKKSKLKGFGIIMGHAAGGAVVGSIIAYDLMGMQETIALHGYNIAAGAAAGALMGTAVALLRHGPEAVLEPGDDLNMNIDQDLLIPAATSPTVKPPALNLPGLEVSVQKTKVIKDGLDGYQLQLDAIITNNTNTRLESIDLFIEDDNGSRYPIVADSEEDKTDMVFTVDPRSIEHVHCDFPLEYPKLKRKLVWVDHTSRQVLFSQKLP